MDVKFNFAAESGTAVQSWTCRPLFNILRLGADLFSVASTTLGRPMMMPSQVTIPLPSMSQESVHEDLDGSSSPFYVETIKLYSILGRIVSTVYSPWSPQGASCDPERNENRSHIQLNEAAVMSFDEELSDFEEGIVTCLHWKRGTSTRISLKKESQYLLQRQSNVLRTR